MNKILVVFTGGTIGSKKESNIINVDEKTSYLLIEEFRKHSPDRDVHFDIIQPLNILSEDLIPENWNTIINCLKNITFSDYDGIILTHGSDTLPYTSAAISYAFNYTSIPIVLTASNYPIDDPRSNGLSNFENSVNFILNEKLPGVFVIFKNSDEISYVHIGTRLTEGFCYDMGTGKFNFDSFNRIHFGQINNGIFIRNDHEFNPTHHQFNIKKVPINIEEIRFSDDILFISPRPGLNYKHFQFEQDKPKAILHNLYHSATACTCGTGCDKYSVIEFANYCLLNGIDLYICPVTNLYGDQYNSLKIILQYRGIPFQNISVEAAVVKLMIAYGNINDREVLSKFIINNNIFFEHIGFKEY